jgi:hypothetical protein
MNTHHSLPIPEKLSAQLGGCSLSLFLVLSVNDGKRSANPQGWDG